MAARGVLAGIAAFSAVIFAAPLDSATIFYAGAFGIGWGGGIFGISTLTAAMTLPRTGGAGAGLALGAWGAAQATAAGLAILIGGTLRDVVTHLVEAGHLGGLSDPSVGYSFVYHIEIGLLFATLAVLGPLVKLGILNHKTKPGEGGLRLVEFPT
jgi:BCD family chlorophyll transporter-like MFS transporter